MTAALHSSLRLHTHTSSQRHSFSILAARIEKDAAKRHRLKAGTRTPYNCYAAQKAPAYAAQKAATPRTGTEPAHTHFPSTARAPAAHRAAATRRAGAWPLEPLRLCISVSSLYLSIVSVSLYRLCVSVSSLYLSIVSVSQYRLCISVSSLCLSIVSVSRLCISVSLPRRPLCLIAVDSDETMAGFIRINHRRLAARAADRVA